MRIKGLDRHELEEIQRELEAKDADQADADLLRTVGEPVEVGQQPWHHWINPNLN